MPPFLEWMLVCSPGFVLILLGALIRAGRLRTLKGGLWVGAYRTHTDPWVKNRFFTAVPIGLVWMLGPSALYVDGTARAAMFALAALSALLAIYISMFAPGWAKPAWLVAEDADYARRRAERGRPPKPKRSPFTGRVKKT